VTSPLDPDLWRRASAVLDSALDLPAAERAGLLDGACGGDAELRTLVDELLAAEAKSEGFLEQPAAAGAESLLRELADEGPPEGLSAGPWKLLREIGRGGMGVVYLAERADGEFEQSAALKLVKRGLDSEDLVARFRRERQILARLRHPHIALLLDGGLASDGRPWFAMEHVEGEPITRWCAAHGLTVEARLKLFLTVCEAVQHAHRNLVVHCDLKPSNILVTPQGQVKLLDFGIARLLSDAAGTDAPPATTPEGTALTPEYAAPEQIRGEPPTTATDVYGLGVVLHELLTAHRPSEVRAILPSQAPELAEPARRRLRGDLDAVVLKALRPEPEQRYPSAEALATDLRRHLDALPIAARANTLGYRSGKFLLRHRLAASAAGLLLLSLLAGLGGTLWQARAARREAARTDQVRAFLVSLFEVSDPAQSHGETITARELLDRGALRVEAELQGQPEAQATLLATLADVNLKLGLPDPALALADKAMALDRSLHGDEDVAVADDQHRRGLALLGKGDHEQAQQALEEALTLHRRLLGPRDARVAEDLDDLASVLRARGQLDDAMARVREALDVRRALAAPGPELATSMNNLAVMLREKGRFDEAEPLYRETLAVRRQTLGPDHPDVAVTLNNLAALLRQKGQLEEAERVAREALTLNRRLFGADNVNSIGSANNLAAILQSLGRYSEAEELHRGVLDFWRRTQGPEHPNALVTLNNLASVLKDLGREDEAMALFRQLIATWPRVLGPTHPFNAVSRTHLASMLRERGEYAEADRLYHEALDLYVALQGDQHPDAATVHHHLGLLALAEGKLDQAENELRGALAVREKALGPAHGLTAQSRLMHGSVLREQGRAAEGAELQRMALEACRKAWPARHPEVATAALELGRTLAALGNSGEACPLLREALSIREGVFGADGRRTAEARRGVESCPPATGTAPSP